jgi:hypothetical protein
MITEQAAAIHGATIDDVDAIAHTVQPFIDGTRHCHATGGARMTQARPAPSDRRAQGRHRTAGTGRTGQRVAEAELHELDAPERLDWRAI